MDLHAAIRLERASVTFTFPQLRKVPEGTFNADDWNAVVRGLSIYDNTGSAWSGKARDVGPAVTGMLLYPRAKQYLIDRGLTREQVEAMPVSQVLGRHMIEAYDAWFDDMVKWAALPYWQAHDGLMRAQDAFAVAERGMPRTPLMAFLPALGRATFTGAKLDRSIAAVQTVEAIRAYAATHDGQPPAKLDDLTDTPPPLDPTTGRTFAYAVDGGRVTLESPAPKGYPAVEGLRVEVTVVK